MEFNKDITVTRNNIVELLDAGESISYVWSERDITQQEKSNMQSKYVRDNLPETIMVSVNKTKQVYSVRCHDTTRYIKHKTRERIFTEVPDMFVYLEFLGVFDDGWKATVSDHQAFLNWRNDYIKSDEYKNSSESLTGLIRSWREDRQDATDWSDILYTLENASDTDVITYYKYIQPASKTFATGKSGFLIAIKKDTVYFINPEKRDVTYYKPIGAWDNYPSTIINMLKTICDNDGCWFTPATFFNYDMEKLATFIERSEEYFNYDK